MLPSTSIFLSVAVLLSLLLSVLSFSKPEMMTSTTPSNMKKTAVLEASTLASSLPVISPTPSIPLTKNDVKASVKNKKLPTTQLSATPVVTKKPTPTVINSIVTPTSSKDKSIAPQVAIPSGSSWQIKSVSSMKETKDAVCNQRSDDFILKWVNKAEELGVNYISIETPYENPSCGDALSYTKKWITAIRTRGLKVWHRHMPLAFEGIYNTSKIANLSTMPIIQSYIRSNPDLFKEGDIFTPIPEPQNGGISGITYCSQNVCEFNSRDDFNAFLRDAMNKANDAFGEIGLRDKVKIGYYGFDGFVAWGDNNPDWHGILDESTISQMGNITIDHYPEQVNESMKKSLDDLQRKYPGIPIVIGEWGRVTTSDPIRSITETMSAAKRPGVIGFNYWHMGMGGSEALINDDFSNKTGFEIVKSFYSQ